MKKVAALAAVALLLTGCAGQATAEPAPTETVYVTQTPEPTETPKPSVDTEDVTATPVEVEPVPVEAEEAPTYATPEDQFVAETNEVLTGWGLQPLDAETALAGGQYLCDELAAGATSETAEAFGEVGAAVVHDISDVAQNTIC